MSVITLPDIRWGRCDIKSIDLLPNVLAKQEAKEQGAFEAWFVDAQGLVTEGASSNAWIIDADGVLRTRELHANILRGVTRRSLVELARKAGLTVRATTLFRGRGQAAREAFVTGAGHWSCRSYRSTSVTIANGHPGGWRNAEGPLYPAGPRSAI